MTVRLSEMYTYPEQIDEMYVAALCLMASWGLSNVVRYVLSECCDLMISDAQSVLTDRARVESIICMIAEMPFMDEYWRPDENNNDQLPKAVESLLHEWSASCGGPWNTNAESIERAMAYCKRVGEIAVTRYRHILPRNLVAQALMAYSKKDGSYSVDSDTLSKCEVGAQLADIITPFGGDSCIPEKFSHCRDCARTSQARANCTLGVPRGAAPPSRPRA